MSYGDCNFQKSRRDTLRVIAFVLITVVPTLAGLTVVIVYGEPNPAPCHATGMRNLPDSNIILTRENQNG